MEAALAEARQGLAEGGIPIGSVLVHQGRIIGRGRQFGHCGRHIGHTDIQSRRQLSGWRGRQFIQRDVE